MYSKIPKMDEILGRDKIKILSDSVDIEAIKDLANDILNGFRNDIRNGITEDELDRKIERLDDDIIESFSSLKEDRLRPLVNATGTVIHTNLGRSLISKDMVSSIENILLGYSNLEFDLEKGVRGLRYSHIESLITKVTGAEAAMVVNNNASAVLLVLSEFAKGKEAIISRGELIEIGGSFRIPDVMEASGCELREVGTTNKTHLFDYERAINENTGVILKVHTSNYRVVGFTEDVKAFELKKLANDNELPLIEDLGSGVLVNLEEYGLMHEPTVQESVESGIDIITFSGDKLLGGPQAGIIIGKKKYIDRLKRNQLTRALRVDKMTIKLLEEIFKVYLYEKDPVKKIPTLNMITKSKENILEDSKKVSKGLKKLGYEAEVVEDYSEVGGGSLPTEKLPTYVVKVSDDELSEGEIDYRLRHLKYPVVGRIHKEYFIIDPRTFIDDDVKRVISAFKEIKES
ncbi:L-seryl-tRNA(Sec) selenium transferase [Ezakiella coagulans]|uniref:L-seryl-tRNA(Sec) selenium transferase n=1 Tax=Ezakiella coagulans TaxID=46507 RepID=A0A2U1E2G5_9FIRM|nr:L-seryl-tRNA(Sec) selenium transferase [Ezakiella coagulans]KGF07839.1 selenocysteine synthase [Tissierellia bacterium S7-1-4]PVY94022.1 L-seryl-tRNA(Sec) selenium transferase [Ezakiella coagulans]